MQTPGSEGGGAEGLGSRAVGKDRLTNEGDLVTSSTQCPTAQHRVISQVPVQAEVANEEPPAILAELQAPPTSRGQGPPFPSPGCSRRWGTARSLQGHLCLP